MRGTSEIADRISGLQRLARDSLFLVTEIYRRRPDGSLWYRGERPSGSWHAHGSCEKTLVVLQDGKPVRKRLHKQRWRLVGTHTTSHSRPPDDLHMVRFCTLVVVLRICAFVMSPVGFHRRAELGPGLEEGCGSDRTVQRWTARAMTRALDTQQAIRAAILELRRREPRPEEDWFRGGLSPPPVVSQRRWGSRALHQMLYESFAMLFVGAKELGTHVASLLAEARRRCHPQSDSFPF